jgi:hypothetical protein
MKININNFSKLLRKSTLNYGIESLQLRFSEGRIKCDSINQSGTSISILNVPNDVIDVNDEIIFNFTDPSQQVIPYFKLYAADGIEDIDIQIEELFLLINDSQHKEYSKITFAVPKSIKRLGTDDVKNVDWFYEVPIDKEMIKKFEKIKAIGSRFGKVYIDLVDTNLYVNTCDKTNRYSAGQKFQIGTVDMHDLSLAYTYVDAVNFFHCIEMDIEKNFMMKIAYQEDQKLGCVYAYSENGEEKYSLISRENL